MHGDTFNGTYFSFNAAKAIVQQLRADGYRVTVDTRPTKGAVVIIVRAVWSPDLAYSIPAQPPVTINGE